MSPSNPHVQQEIAVVWSGGGRRWFSQRAAMRGAAKAIIRTHLKHHGETMETDEFQQLVKQLVGKIARGERPEIDWDALGAAASEAAE